MTKHQTYREDLEQDLLFDQAFTKHYRSWLSFAREKGYNVKLHDLLLVTGVDLTKDFAMLAFDNNGGDFSVDFSVGASSIASATASAWGSWRTITSVHKNWGPQALIPPGSARLAMTAAGEAAPRVSREYNQCVFVRGYRLRERLLWPKVIRAAAGPKDFDGAEDEEEPESTGWEEGEEEVDVVHAGDIPLASWA
jgi:hypothetical protein